MVQAIVNRILVALAVIFYGPELGCPNTQSATPAIAKPVSFSSTCPVLLPIQLSYFTPLAFTHPTTPDILSRTTFNALPLNVCAPLLPIQRLKAPVTVTTINDIAAALGAAGPESWAKVSKEVFALERENTNAAFWERTKNLALAHFEAFPRHPWHSTWHILNALWSSTTYTSNLVIAVQLLIIIRQWLLLRRARKLILSKERTVAGLFKWIFHYMRKIGNLEALVTGLKEDLTRQEDSHTRLMKIACKRLQVFKTCTQLLHNFKINARDGKIARLETQLAQALKNIHDMIVAHDVQLTSKANRSDELVEVKDNEIRTTKESLDAVLLDNGQLREELQRAQEQLCQRSLDIEELEGLRETNEELKDIVDRLEEEEDVRGFPSLPSTPALTIGDSASIFTGPSDSASDILSRDLPILRAASSKRRLSAEFNWLRKLKKALQKGKR